MLKPRAVLCLLALAASAARAQPEGDKLDLKYMYYWDRNGVWNHTPAISLWKSLSRTLSLRWNQEMDLVSGASRRLGMRNIGREGDNQLVLDGISGASKREVRHSEQAALHFAEEGRTATASFYFSQETDYTSYAPAVAASWDFHQRNTTLGAGLELFFDELHPVGPFADLGGTRRLTSGTVSLTQVVTRTSLAALTANLIHSTGVLGHPYNPVILANGSLLLERLPAGKLSAALGAQWIQGFHLAGRLGSLRLESRYYRDTWELASGTADLQWYQYLAGQTYVRLRARGYMQGAAAFYREAYAGDEAYHTADLRYAAFSSLTLGFKLGSTFPDSWLDTPLLPDGWDISYDHGMRDTRGEETRATPFYHYQLFASDEYYLQGTLMAGIRFDL